MELPFFGWFLGPLIRVAGKRKVAYAIARLRHQLDGAPEPEPPRSVVGLPSVPFSAEQGVLLASASAAVALTTFASALFGQLAGPIGDSFDTSDATLTNALAITRVGAILALFATALADRRGGGDGDPPRRRGHRVRLRAVRGRADARRLHLRAGPPARVHQHDPDRRRHRRDRGGTRRRARLLRVDARARGRVRVLVRSRRVARSTSVRTAGASRTSPARSRSFSGRASRAPCARRRATSAIAARTEIRRGQLRELVDPRYGPRFVLLAVIGFLANVFNAPSSQLMNKYLEDVRDFSSPGIALFRTVTTALPGLVGLVLGGRLAEKYGRKPVAITALLVATTSQMVFFLQGGTVLWVMSAVSVLTSSAAGVALGTLDAELFPTELRGTSNALLLIVSVLGSGAGLLIAGHLADPLGGIGRSIALCGIAGLLAAVFFVPRLPETNEQSIDEVSPSERPEEYGPDRAPN